MSVLSATTTTAHARIDFWDLRLYVAGNSLKGVLAMNNLRLLCETCICGKYHIEVIDVLERPELAEKDCIMALPTLIRRSPLPVRKIIGDLSDSDRVMEALDLARNG